MLFPPTRARGAEAVGEENSQQNRPPPHRWKGVGGGSSIRPTPILPPVLEIRVPGFFLSALEVVEDEHRGLFRLVCERSATILQATNAGERAQQRLSVVPRVLEPSVSPLGDRRASVKPSQVRVHEERVQDVVLKPSKPERACSPLDEPLEVEHRVRVLWLCSTRLHPPLPASKASDTEQGKEQDRVSVFVSFLVSDI